MLLIQLPIVLAVISRTATGTVVTCAARMMNSNTPTRNEEAMSLIYPNPAKGSINIKGDFIIAGTTLTITNLLGKQVIVQLLSIGNNTIDISSLPKGFYIATIQTAEGRKTQKLIVE